MTDPRPMASYTHDYSIPIPYDTEGTLSFTATGTHELVKLDKFKITVTLSGSNIWKTTKSIEAFHDMIIGVCDSRTSSREIVKKLMLTPPTREGTMLLVRLAIQYGAPSQVGFLLKSFNATHYERMALRDHARKCGYADSSEVMRIIVKFEPIEGFIYVSTDDEITTAVTQNNGAKITYKVTFEPELDLALTVTGHHEKSIHSCWCIMTAMRGIVDGQTPHHIEEVNAVTRPVYAVIQEWKQFTAPIVPPIVPPVAATIVATSVAPIVAPIVATSVAPVAAPIQTTQAPLCQLPNIRPHTDNATFKLKWNHVTYDVKFTYTNGVVGYSFTPMTYGLDALIQSMINGKFETRYVQEGLLQWYKLASWLDQYGILADKLRWREFKFEQDIVVSIDRADVTKYVICGSARTDEIVATCRDVVTNKWSPCTCPLHKTTMQNTLHQIYVWLHAEKHRDLPMDDSAIKELITDRARWH